MNCDLSSSHDCCAESTNINGYGDINISSCAFYSSLVNLNLNSIAQKLTLNKNMFIDATNIVELHVINCNVDIEFQAFVHNSLLEVIDFHGSTTKFASNICYYNYKIRYVNVGKVSSIGINAFLRMTNQNCVPLEAFVFEEGSTIEKFDNNMITFAEISYFVVPDSVSEAFKYSSIWYYNNHPNITTVEFLTTDSATAQNQIDLLTSNLYLFEGITTTIILQPGVTATVSIPGVKIIYSNTDDSSSTYDSESSSSEPFSETESSSLSETKHPPSEYFTSSEIDFEFAIKSLIILVNLFLLSF